MDKKANSTLNGKKVIVLGGTSGIGLATAKAAAAEGAIVTVASSNSERVANALQELPSSATGVTIDLAKEAHIQQFFVQLGAFDHLVYTAAENIRLQYLSDTDIEEARTYFNLRYWGAFAAVKYGAPNIREGGSITLISGIASLRPGPGWALGASICGAMDAFVRGLAVELAPIRVNNVSPGVIKTNLWNSMSETERENLYESVGKSLPVRRVGEAEDIAASFIYLMKQSFCTGQTLVVDGGTVLV